MPKLIIDQFSSMLVSRQTKYKLRRLERNQCPTCGHPKEPDCATYACNRCAATNVERMKALRDNPVLDLI